MSPKYPCHTESLPEKQKSASQVLKSSVQKPQPTFHCGRFCAMFDLTEEIVSLKVEKRSFPQPVGSNQPGPLKLYLKHP